jgi:hypothetical protein
VYPLNLEELQRNRMQNGRRNALQIYSPNIFGANPIENQPQ